MKYARSVLVALLFAFAGGSAFAEGAPWGDRGWSAEFKYFQERGAFTPEAWSALAPEAQQKALDAARKPARERREEVDEYYAAASKKWDGAALKKFTGTPQDAFIRAVNVWLGKEQAEALARKLALVRTKLDKAGRGLDDRDAQDLAPYLTPEAIDGLLAPKGAAALPDGKDKAAEPPPVSASASSLDKFAAEGPAALNAGGFSRLYDGMNVSGKGPAVAGGAGYVANDAGRAGGGTLLTSAAPKKAPATMPQPKGRAVNGPAPAADKRSDAWTSDAYGFTITAGGQTQTFRDQKEAEAAIRKLPDGSITNIILYGHGSPGMQTVGPATYDSETAGRLLQGKMARNGVVQFSGCNTASIGGATLNPAVGLSMITRRLLYFSLPYFQDRLNGTPADEARRQWNKEWNRDLAQETSEYVKDAVVCGYRTFGLVPGRLPVVTHFMGNQEATTPGYVAGKKACYKNGQEVPAP